MAPPVTLMPVGCMALISGKSFLKSGSEDASFARAAVTPPRKAFMSPPARSLRYAVYALPGSPPPAGSGVPLSTGGGGGPAGFLAGRTKGGGDWGFSSKEACLFWLLYLAGAWG